MIKKQMLRPDNVERAYARLLVAYSDEVNAKTLDVLSESDAYSNPGVLANIFLLLYYLMLGRSAGVVKSLPAVFTGISDFNDAQWIDQVKNLTGLTVPASNGAISSFIDDTAAVKLVATASGVSSDIINSVATTGMLPANSGVSENGPQYTVAASLGAGLAAPGVRLANSVSAARSGGGGGGGFGRSMGLMSSPHDIELKLGPVDVYRSEPWLIGMQEQWIAENTALIASVSSQQLDKIEQIIRAGVMQGSSPKAMADQIRDAGVKDQGRAMRIARDQVGKANGLLTQQRQIDLGVTSYDWVTSHDERVRGDPTGLYPRANPSHYARDGKVFDWDSPPEGGAPGIAILCRCWARARFDFSESANQDE